MEEKGGYFMLQSKKKIYGLLCLACVVFFSLFLLLFHTAGGFSSGNQVPILMYHHLAPAGTYSGTGDADNGAIITPEAFAQQMAYLAQAGYTSLFLSELVELLQNGEELPEKAVVITFDDGYESNYIYAYPILKQYGLKATINVVVASSETAVEQESYDPKPLTHLTFKQMAEMTASGLIEIQSHSYDSHGQIVIDAAGNTDCALVNRAYLAETSQVETEEQYKERIKSDVVKAKTILEEKIGAAVTCFAYPYGRANETLQKVLLEVGYQGAVTVKNGFVNAKSNIMALPRITIDNHDDLTSFINKITP